MKKTFGTQDKELQDRFLCQIITERSSRSVQFNCPKTCRKREMQVLGFASIEQVLALAHKELILGRPTSPDWLTAAFLSEMGVSCHLTLTT